MSDNLRMGGALECACPHDPVRFVRTHVALRSCDELGVLEVRRNAASEALPVSAGETLETLLPGVGRTAHTEEGVVLGTRPGGWLIIGRSEALSRTQLTLSAVHAVVTDLSHALAHLVLTGREARRLLAHGCSLDLQTSPDCVSRSAQTLIADVPVVIYLSAPEAFHILVEYSLATYLGDWLQDAAEGLNTPITTSGTAL